MLSLVLLKQVHATPFQIAVLTMALPCVSILSFYWSSILKAHPTWQRSNLILATVLAPFLYFFSCFFESPTFFIVASCCFMLFWRGGNPALMEIIKASCSEEDRAKLYSTLYRWSFAINIIFSPLIGYFLKTYPEWWTVLFCVLGLLYALSAAIYYRIPGKWQTSVCIPIPQGSWSERIIDPWRVSFDLLSKKKLFRYYQIGFFLGGFGLMITRPSVDMILASLPLSYMDLALACSALKSGAILLSAHLWASSLQKKRILCTSGYVLVGFLLFYLLIGSTFCFPSSIFFAYVIYGFAQSGSHLVWNLSGTLVADKESSTPYSSVNVLAVGVRGLIAPMLGAFTAKYLGLYSTLVIGSFITLVGIFYFRSKAQECERKTIRASVFVTEEP